MSEAIDSRERYWVKFDAVNLVFRIVIARCVWDAVKEYIDTKQFEVTVTDDYVVIDISLKEPDVSKIPKFLSDLLPTLTSVKVDTDLHDNQQLMISLYGFGTQDGLSGYSFDIATSHQFRMWEGKQDPQLEQEVRDIISEIYHCLNRLADIEFIRMDTDSTVIAPVYSGFRLVTFGNCACLGYDMSRDTNESDRFIHLFPHNIDALAQQLSLFAGIAFLWGRAREDLYGSLPTAPTS